MVTLTVLANGGAHTFWMSGSAADLQPLVDAFKASRGVTNEPWLEFTSADSERIVFDWFRVDGLSIVEQPEQAEHGRGILAGA